MIRSRWTVLGLGVTLAFGLAALLPVRAQDEDSKSVDEVLEQFQERIGQFQIGEEEPDADQLREDINGLRSQLQELNELRMDMALALAEVRANMAGQQGGQFAAYAGGGFGGQFQAQGGLGPAGARVAADPSASQNGDDDERRDRMRREALTRELKQVRDQFRGEVEQAKNQANNYVQQLRSLREQQQRIQEQQEQQRKQQEEAKAKTKAQESQEDDNNDNNDSED